MLGIAGKHNARLMQMDTGSPTMALGRRESQSSRCSKRRSRSGSERTGSLFPAPTGGKDLSDNYGRSNDFSPLSGLWNSGRHSGVCLVTAQLLSDRARRRRRGESRPNIGLTSCGWRVNSRRSRKVFPVLSWELQKPTLKTVTFCSLFFLIFFFKREVTKWGHV